MPVSVVPVVLVPEDVTLAAGSWQWGQESRNLLRLLRSQQLDVRERQLPPEPGEKGAASEIILALGASGTIGALTTVLLNWLNRRSTRRIKLIVGDQTFEMSGEGFSDSSFKAAVLAALGWPGDAVGEDPALPTGDTAPESPDR